QVDMCTAAVAEYKSGTVLYTGSLKVTVVGFGTGVGVGVGVGLGVGVGWPMANRGAGVGRAAAILYVGDANTVIAPATSANNASRKRMADLMFVDGARQGRSPVCQSGDCT